MTKAEVSNLINRLTGGHEYLFCTRVHFNSKVWGGSWIALRIIIDVAFKILRKQNQHCKRSALWEYRNGSKNKRVP